MPNALVELALSIGKAGWAEYLDASACGCTDSAARQERWVRQVCTALGIEQLTACQAEGAEEILAEAIRAEELWDRAPADPPPFKGAPPAVMEKRGMTAVMREGFEIDEPGEDQTSGESQ